MSLLRVQRVVQPEAKTARLGAPTAAFATPVPKK
jgi:hypothetical protein